MKLFELFFVLGLLGSFHFVTGCATENATADTDTDGDGDGEVENIPSTDAFQVKVNTSTEWDIVISKNGDGATPCVAEEGEDVFCVIDMPELDMYFRGFTINDAMPGTMCKYKNFRPYFYNIAPVGIEPSHVFYEENADGVLLPPTTAVPATLSSTISARGLAGTVTDDVWYYIGGEWYYHGELYGEAATSADDIRCPYDYTEVLLNGRNCCRLNYSLLARVDGEVSNTVSDWGGSLANCFEGPGMDTYTAFGEDGLPIETITDVDPTAGLTGSFSVAAPITKVELDQPQIYAASYYDSDDHGSNVPGALRVILGYRPWGSSAHFLYECLDSHHEIVARIRVVAREWNELTEYLAFVAGTSADPDTEGPDTDPTNSEGSSISEPTDLLNDYADWRDIEEADDANADTIDDLGHPYTYFGFANLSLLDGNLSVGGVQPLLNEMIPYNHSHYIGFAD